MQSVTAPGVCSTRRHQMFEGAIGGLGIAKLLPPMNFSGEIPVNFQILTGLCHPFGSFFQSNSVVAFTLSAACSIVVLTVPAWLIYCKKKRKTDYSIIAPAINRSDAAGDSMERLPSATGEDLAEELQFCEAILASIVDYEMENTASSSMEQVLLLDTKLEVENEVNNSYPCFCEICLENQESWRMFTNCSCSHSFCYDCTRKHIITRIKDKVKTITCPALNCNATLDANICRLMIPDDALIQWDESLCQSLIPESQKVYCPFTDCSAMFVNDSYALITEANCLVCHRSFCAQCRVPWHPEFKCEEYSKLYGKQGRKDEVMVSTLAKKKSWQKCPKCKMYVEKIDGCIHITCRCKYEFCYRCGAKWTGTHSGCRKKFNQQKWFTGFVIKS